MISVNKKLGRAIVRFDPSFFKKAYKSYQAGNPRELIALMKEASVDSHVTGCLLGRRAGFQKDWSIRPYEDSNSDQQRAEALTQMFSALNTRLLFKKLHEAILYMYSVVDFEWEVVNNLQVITSFKHFAQHYFKYDEDGILKVDFGKTAEEIPPETLVCESTETPAMLPVLRDYILKNFGLEAWASFIETFGEGLLIGKYPSGSGPEMRAELQEALDNIARSSRGTMPKETEIEVVETKRTTGDHSRFEERSNIGISIALLGHANAVQDSAGMHIGENLAPFKVAKNIALDDIQYIEPCMNKLIRIVYSRNWNDNRFPLFVMDKSDPVVVKDRLDTLQTYYDMGGEVDPDDFAKLGITIAGDQKPLVRTDPF